MRPSLVSVGRTMNLFSVIVNLLVLKRMVNGRELRRLSARNPSGNFFVHHRP